MFTSEEHKRRPERIAELVLREIASMLVRELRDPRLQGVTLTRARVSADLRHCRVFFSHLEGASKASVALAGFRCARGFIRQRVGRSLGMRVTPDLSFEFDPTLENAARIDLLLREAASKQ
jgi:ribosome-binding factor A